MRKLHESDRWDPPMQYTRYGAMSALILGFFASSWFGWAQEKPPPGWRSPLIVGMVLSLIVAAVGAVCAWRNWSSGSALKAPNTTCSRSI
jgi:hypothetical protein